MPDLSLREQIEQAMSTAAGEKPEVVEETVEETPEVVEESPDVEAAEEDAEESEEEGDEESEDDPDEAPEPQKPAEIPKPPAALKGDLKARWAELPDDVRKEFIRLEQTQAKGVQKIAEDANFGKSMKQVIQPYEAVLRAVGASPEKAVSALLNADYQLRTSSPAQKQALFVNLAQQYGVDVKGLASEKPPQIDPNISYLEQRLSQWEQQQIQQQTAQQQAQEAALMSGISQFLEGPDTEYFGDVQNAVLKLVEPFAPGELQTVQAVQERLRKAYDQACWAVPEIRQQILAKQQAAQEAERKSKEKANVQKKKVAGSSVRGGTTKSSAGKIDPDMPLRDLIAQHVYGDAERI